MANIINYLLFQLNWLACVYAASQHNNWLALTSTALFLLCHFSFYHWRKTDLKLIVLGITIGLLLDSMWSFLALIHYQAQPLFPMAPVWILCLWVNFMLTINHSMAWINDKPMLASIGAAIAGPLSYYFGAEMGAIDWLQPITAMIFLGLSWASVMPIILELASVWRKSEQASQHALV